MIGRDEIVCFLNNVLAIDTFRDACPNGLQVEGKEAIHRIAFGVSASQQFFEQAAQAGADMVIVHHGLLWGEQPARIKGLLRQRLKILLDYDLSLLAYHLPLDAHPVYGNNAQIASRLGLQGCQPFGRSGKYPALGVSGQLPTKIAAAEMVAQIEACFGNSSIWLNFGRPEIESVALISGGAHSYIHEAIESGCDLFLTGNIDEPVQEAAREGAIHYVAAGHYHTEKFGIQALQQLLTREFGIEGIWIDIPNAY
jgi:dinuclear metal center YbgI/SA1388 family protein